MLTHGALYGAPLFYCQIICIFCFLIFPTTLLTCEVRLKRNENEFGWRLSEKTVTACELLCDVHVFLLVIVDERLKKESNFVFFVLDLGQRGQG
jgi:hypothetical protein